MYGHQLDPSYFCKNFELSGKVQTLGKRRMARAMLAGAPLFAAQLGAYEIRKILDSGAKETSIDLAARGTAAQFIKMLAKLSPLGILKLVNKHLHDQLSERLLQHADDLDYVQEVVNLTAEKPEVNPPMNAIADAFSRRRFSGRFKINNQSVSLDTLLNTGTAASDDKDLMVARRELAAQQRGSSTYASRPCFLFQSGNCSFKPCRYRHECIKCHSTSHGSRDCDQRQADRSNRWKLQPSGSSPPKTLGPPHPRFRRDRARVAPK